MNTEEKNQPKTPQQQQHGQPRTTNESQNNPTQSSENKNPSQDTSKKNPSQGTGQPQENFDKSHQDRDRKAS
jgi:hypothetical protein